MATSLGTIYYEVDAKTGQLLVAQRQADQAFDSIERGAKRADRQVNTLKTSIKALSRVIHLLLAAEAVRQFIDMAEQAKMLRVKIKLLTGEAEATERVFNRLKDISKETGQSLKDTGDLWQGLAISLKNTSATEGQVLNLVSTLQKLGSLGGVSAEQLSNSMRQFRQAIDAGVLQAEEFNSIRDNTPTIVQEMARQMGLSMGQFRAEMLDGKITAERMLNAIQASTQETNEKFAQLPRTTGIAFNELKVEMMGVVEELDNLFGISDGVVTAIDLITGGVEGLGKGTKFAATCFNTLKTAGSEFIDIFDDVAVKAGEVAEEIIRMVTPIKALMDGYKWMKEIVDKRKEELNSNNEKKFGPTVGKVMTFANDIKNATAAYDEFMEKQGEADDGKITGFDQPVGKPKKPKKQKKSEADRLGDEGIKVSDQYNKDAAAMRKALENGKAIDAAFAQGKITLLEYKAAQKGIGKELKDELAQIPVDELRDKWDHIVSPMDQLKGEIDPIKQVQNEWAVRKQMLLDLGATEAQQRQAQLEYEQQIRDLKWEQWQAQSDTNSLIGACVSGLKGGMGNALTGLLNGTQSLSEVFANLGSSILNTVGNKLSEIAANWIADQLMMETQSKATQASTTAGAVAAQGEIAAAAAPAAAATAASTGGSWAAAGAAALSAIMSLATSIFGGGRYNGGSVNGGSLYRVGEHGIPELFQTSNGRQYMIPGENGRVIPGRDLFNGGGINMPVNITVQTTNGFSDEDSRRLEQTMERVAMKMMARESQRPGGMLQPRRK
ncbi:tape measure protein [Escherichia coli]|nr:tape measure protein [Escherichia coli]MCK3282449.1 tape measure protein [Escherichia coli]